MILARIHKQYMVTKIKIPSVFKYGRADLIKFEREFTPLLDIVYDLWTSGKLSNALQFVADKNSGESVDTNTKSSSQYTY